MKSYFNATRSSTLSRWIAALIFLTTITFNIVASANLTPANAVTSDAPVLSYYDSAQSSSKPYIKLILVSPSTTPSYYMYSINGSAYDSQTTSSGSCTQSSFSATSVSIYGTTCNSGRNLSSGTSYQIKLKPFYSSTKTFGAESSLITITAGVASTPYSLDTMTAGDKSLQFNFRAYTSTTNRYPASKFEYSTDGINWADTSTANGVTITPGATGGSGSTAYRNYTIKVTRLSQDTSTALSNGTTYSVYMRASNSTGPGSSSLAITGTPGSAPDTPTITSVVPTTNGYTVNWNTPANNGSSITAYKVETATSSGGPYTVYSSSISKDSNTFTLTGLNPGTGYYLRLSAINGVGTSGGAIYSATYKVGVPTQLTIDTITVGVSGQLTISFTIPGNSPTSYKYTTDSSTPTSSSNSISPTFTGNMGTFVLTGLTNGTTYGIRIMGINSSGNGIPSDIALVAPSNGAVAPSKPTISATYTPGNNSVQINYSVKSNGGANIESAEYSTNGTNWVSLPDTSTTQTITKESVAGTPNFVNGTTYNIYVRVRNSQGYSPASDALAVTPSAVPSQVSGVTTSITDSGTIRVNWSAPSGNGSTVDEYLLEKYVSGSWSNVDYTASTSYSIAGLIAGTSYSFRVSAHNTNGYGAVSATTAGITAIAYASAPVITSIVVSSGPTLTISFTAQTNGSASAGYDTITSYEYSTDTGTTWASVADNSSPITITTDSTGAPFAAGTYNVQIRAVNSLGSSLTGASSSGAASTTSSVVVKVDQATVNTPTASSNSHVYGDTFTVSVTGGSGTGTYSYDAGSSTACSISGNTVTITSGSGTCLITATRAGDSSYNVSAASSPLSITVNKAPLAMPIETLTASSTTSISVSFSTVTGQGNDTITVVKTSDSSTVSTTNASSSPVTITGLSAGTSYSVTVTAIGDANHSDTTTAYSTITTLSNAGAPTVSISATSLSRTAGQTDTFTASATSPDGGVLTYQWYKKGVALSGETNTTYITPALTTGNNGDTYTVVVTNTKSGTSTPTTSNILTLSVGAAPTITTPTGSGLTGTYNSPYSLTLSGTGTAPLTYTSSSTFPTGLSLSSSGVISGTPTQVGSFNVSVTVTDSNSVTATTSSFTIVINKAPLAMPVETLTATSPTQITVSYSTVTGAASYTVNVYQNDGTTLVGSSHTNFTSGSTIGSLTAGTTYKVAVTAVADSNHSDTTTAQASVATSSKTTPTFSTWSGVSKTYGDTYTITAPTVTGGLAGGFTYSSSDTTVASVSGTTITANKVGSATITATFTPSDAATYNSATTTMTFTVGAKTLTISGATISSKTYDAGTTALVSGTLALSGLISGDTGYVSVDTSSVVANFNNATAGNSKPVTVSGINLAGSKASNYWLTQPTGLTGNITKANPLAANAWSTPTSTRVGLALNNGGSRLNATALTAGTFVYTDPSSNVITDTSSISVSGSITLTATFHPTDTTNYLDNQVVTVVLSVRDAIAPNAPTIDTLTTGSADGQIVVKWTSTTADNGGATISKYEYHYSLATTPYAWSTWATAGSVVESTASKTFTISGLSLGANYVVQIRAYNTAGYSPASAVSPVAKAAGNPISIPAKVTLNSVTALTNVTSVTLKYNAVTGATSYQYSGDNGASWSSIDTATSSSYLVSTITGLTKGITYQFLVRAVNSAGSGTSDGMKSYVAKTVPNAPAINSASFGGSNINSTFTESTDKGGDSSITYYYCYAKSGDNSTCNDDDNWQSVSPSTFSISLSRKDGTYVVYMKAKNSTGYSSIVNASVDALVAGQPTISTPAGDTVTVGQSGGISLSVSTTAGTSGETLTVQWYRNSVAISGATSNTYALTGPVNNGNVSSFVGTYYAVVTETAANGTSNSATSGNAVIGQASALSITTTSMRGGTIGQSGYTTTISGAGGTLINRSAERGGNGYTWAIVSPDTSLFKSDGLVLNTATGVISGKIPTGIAAETKTIQVSITDKSGATVTKSITFLVNAPVSITTKTIGNASTGLPYSVFLTAAGGTTPYAWSIIGDRDSQLPTGFSINVNTGEIRSDSITAGVRSKTFTVRVTDASGATYDQSLTIVITTAVPGVPTITSHAAGNKQVTLTWTPPTEVPGATIINYVINYIKPSGEHSREDGSDDEEQKGSILVSGSSTTAVVPDLTNGLYYDFTISAKSSGGTGNPSDSQRETPMGAASAPKNISLVTKSNGLRLSWKKPEDLGGGTIDNWVVVCKADGSSSTITITDPVKNGDDSSYYVNVNELTGVGITAGQYYSCTVAAHTAAGGNGTTSNASSSALYAKAPSAPTLGSLDTSTANTLNVNWTWTPGFIGDTETSYTAWIRTVGGEDNDSSRRSCTLVSKASSASCSITGVPTKGSYVLQVYATNAYGNSQVDSKTVTLLGKSRTFNSFSTTVNKTVGDPDFSLGIKTNDGAKAQYSVADGETKCSILNDSKMVRVLKAGTCNVTVQQNGKDENDNESEYAPISPVTVQVVIADVIPGPPKISSVRSGNTKLTVTWNAPTTAGKAKSYDIQVNDNGNGWVNAVPANIETSSSTITTDLTGLTNGHPYKIQIRSVNSTGSTSTWDSTTTSTTPAGAPDKPVITDTQTVVNSSTGSVTWTASASNGSAITGYVATAASTSDTSTYTCSTNGSGNTCTFTGLKNKNTYTVTVTGTNGNGSTISDPWTLVLGGRTQSISWIGTKAPDYGYTVGDPNFQLAAQASSGNALIYTSSDDTVCTVSNTYSSAGSVNFLKAGLCTITVAQDGTTWNSGGTARVNTNYSAATSLTQDFNIDPASPSAPTITSITNQSNGLKVTWSGPSRIGANSLAETVTATNGSATFTCAITTTTNISNNCTLLGGGILKGVPYSITVYAHNTAGDGPSSTAKNGTWNTRPSVPLSDSSTATPNGSDPKGIAASWTSPADNGGSLITTYTWVAKPASGSTQSCSVALETSTTCVIHGLRAGRQYSVQGYATNAFGDSDSTTIRTVTPGIPQTIVPDGSVNTGTINSDIKLNYTVTPSNANPVYQSSTPGVCTVTPDGLVHLISSGTCTITIDAPGASDANDSNYIAASQVTKTISSTGSTPDAPTITSLSGSYTSAAPGNASIQVNWNLPANTGGNVISQTATAALGGVTKGTCTVTDTSTSCSIAGLDVNTAYSITVTVTNDASLSATSAVVAKQVEHRITAPVPLTVTGGIGVFNLSWQAPETSTIPVTGYRVTDSLGNITNITSTSISVTGAGPAETRSFFVQATAGETTIGDPTSSETATTFNAPTAPTITSVTPGFSSTPTLTISWSHPTSNGGTPITVETATIDSSHFCTTDGKTNSCTISNLGANTTYTVTVQAANGVGAGLSSSSSNGTTVSLPAATVVTTSSGNASLDQVTVNFTTNGSTKYTIKAYSELDSYTVSTMNCSTTSGSSCIISGLAYKTNYKFTVTPSNAYGDGSESAKAALVNLHDTQSITFPVIADQSISSGSVALNATSSSGLPISYSVDPSTTSGCTVSGSTVTFVGTGICVILANQAGNSRYDSASQKSQAFAITAVAPDAITLTSLTPGSRKLTATWSQAVDLGGANFVKYIVTWSSDVNFTNVASANVTSINTTTFDITSLLPSTPYWVEVKVVTDATAPNNGSTYSNVLNATTFGKPDPVAKPAISTSSAGSVSITWTDITDLAAAGGTPITNYVVKAYVGGIYAGISCTASSTSCTISGLDGTKTYTFKVLDYNAVDFNTSDSSDAINVAQSQSLTIPTKVISKKHSDTTFNLGVTTSSGLPLTYSAVSAIQSYDTSTGTTWMGSRTVCSVDANGVVTVDLAGTCVITVSQDGTDANGLPTVYGATSDTITVNVSATAPSIVVSPTIKSAPSSLILSWGIPTDDGGRHLTQFEVDQTNTRDSSKNRTLVIGLIDTFWDAITSTYTYTARSLDNGTFYQIDIKAINEDGIKGPSLN